MRALVTGASGFAGRHLIDRLRRDGATVVAAGGAHEAGPDLVPIDVLDVESLHAAFDLGRPDVVFHLAAQTYAVNVAGTQNVLAALRDWRDRSGCNPRLLFTSSADVYGAQPSDALPVRESAAPSPRNPYAASKAAAEAIVLGEVRSFGIDALVTRAFNHVGPGQDPAFAVASFATQLATIAKGGPPKMLVGNLEAHRDFLDVRDVADAYARLAENGETGEIYNVCSGTAVQMKHVLAELIRIARVPVEVREDPQRMRPADVEILYGDNAKLRQTTGWAPQISLHRSLQELYRDALDGTSAVARK